jgi:hypothetical protein
MVMTVGISALFGVVLGQRFNVLILIPTLILAMVSTAIIEVMRGAEVWSMALTIVVVATVLQIVYLVGSIVHGVVENLAPRRTLLGNKIRHEALPSHSVRNRFSRSLTR